MGSKTNTIIYFDDDRIEEAAKLAKALRVKKQGARLIAIRHFIGETEPRADAVLVCSSDKDMAAAVVELYGEDLTTVKKVAKGKPSKKAAKGEDDKPEGEEDGFEFK